MIMDHPDAFGAVMTKDKEQASGKYGATYDVDFDKVPRGTGGLFNLRGINSCLLDEETGERATIWFKPEVLKKACNVCSTCFLAFELCQGHYGEKKDEGGKRKMTAEQHAAAARQRINKKAKKTFEF